MKWIFALVGLLATTSLVAGCGGGGGGGGGAPPVKSYVYSGTVTAAAGNAIAGLTVVFNGASPSETLTSTGVFSLSVPATDILASGNTLNVLSGTVTENTAAVGTTGGTGITINVGAPPPPPL